MPWPRHTLQNRILNQLRPIVKRSESWKHELQPLLCNQALHHIWMLCPDVAKETAPTEFDSLARVSHKRMSPPTSSQQTSSQVPGSPRIPTSSQTLPAIFASDFSDLSVKLWRGSASKVTANEPLKSHRQCSRATTTTPPAVPTTALGKKNDNKTLYQALIEK